jgi:hypothetical protein
MLLASLYDVWPLSMLLAASRFLQASLPYCFVGPVVAFIPAVACVPAVARGHDIAFILNQGSIFWSKTDIYSPPPPSEIYIFSPKKQRDFRATLPMTK